MVVGTWKSDDMAVLHDSSVDAGDRIIFDDGTEAVMRPMSLQPTLQHSCDSIATFRHGPSGSDFSIHTGI